jgi:hypothetical protein
MLLMVMLKNRGVLRAEQVAPVYTFGAPAIFCEGDSSCSCGGDQQQQQQLPGPGASRPPSPAAAAAERVHMHAHGPCGCSGGSQQGAEQSAGAGSSSSSSSSSRLLAHLGLRDSHVRNVVMHRDIVPRAFACDYSRLSVADWMRSWGPAYKEHSCLGVEGRKHLYFFTGGGRRAGAAAAAGGGGCGCRACIGGAAPARTARGGRPGPPPHAHATTAGLSSQPAAAPG